MISFILMICTPVVHQQLVFKDQPIQNFAYTCEYEILKGPRVEHLFRLEYDRGKFKETQLQPDRSLWSIRHYDLNRDRIAFFTIASPRVKSSPVDTSSFLWQLAKKYPDAYLKHMHISGSDKGVVNGPTCKQLQRFESVAGSASSILAHETVAGKLCSVYTKGTGSGQKKFEVWDGWILQEESETNGECFRVTKLQFHTKLPPSTFALPKGITIAAPSWIKLVPPPGTKVVPMKGSGNPSIQLPGDRK